MTGWRCAFQNLVAACPAWQTAAYVSTRRPVRASERRTVHQSSLRGILGGQILEQLKGRPTLHHMPMGWCECVSAGERRRYMVLCQPAVGMIVYRATAPATPDDEGFRLPCYPVRAMSCAVRS